jgi:heme-degrading monooxygenase HmoA
MYSASFMFEAGTYNEEFHRLDALIEAAASATPGYLGQETWKSASGERSNVVYYWSTLESLKAFSAHPKHLEAKSRYQQWYKGFHIVIAKIIKSYGTSRRTSGRLNNRFSLYLFDAQRRYVLLCWR